MPGPDAISIEIVFGLAERQELIDVAVDPGTTVREAIEISGIADRFPGQDLHALAVGIWGRVVEPGQVLADGDRVEIYRPLLIDPREARRRLAAEGKFMGAAENQGKDT